MPGVGWTSSLRDLLGAPLDELSARDIARFVERQIRETDELDFKEALYGNADQDKIELCKDIAGMRNHRGGVTILGVKEADGVASECPEVALSDSEERRMRQIVAAGTAPHAAFEIRPVKGSASGKGFYLLIAEPSPSRPHAILVNNGLRYPRRDGTHTRYLGESEVADAYRDRFRGEHQQIDRLGQIANEAVARLDEVDGGLPGDSVEEKRRPWLVVSLVPNGAGSMPISFSGRGEIEKWAISEHSGVDLMDGFFEVPPTASVSVERYTLTGHPDRGRLRYSNAVCFTDGAGTAAAPLPWGLQDRVVLFAPALVWATVAALRVLGRHAVQNARTHGDAVVEARVFGAGMVLGYSFGSDYAEAYPNSHTIREARSRLTISLDALAGDALGVIESARLTLADLFNAFGLAEVQHIAPDGALRLKCFPGGYPVAEWAERHGVATTQEVDWG